MVCPDCKDYELLARRVAELERENKLLREQLQTIAKRLGIKELPSFAKPNTTPTTSKPSGRPAGHEGTGRKTPDEIHEHVELKPVSNCPDCGSLIQVKTRYNRVVTRLVPGHLENVEYDVPQSFCPHCQKTISPIAPNTLPNSRFDLTFLLYIACLRMLGVSIDKIRFLLKTDYGLHVSSATIVNSVHKLAVFLGVDYEQLRLELLKSRQVHGDETSWRVKGKNWWLWEFISNRVAYFTVRQSRGHDVPQEVLSEYKGLFTSDFWAAYNVLSCDKQKCWVHLKRELDKVLKYRYDKEFALFASRLMRLYYFAKSERRHGKRTREFVEAKLRGLLSRKYVNVDCKRLVKTFSRHEKELFAFCSWRGAKANNNHAEQGIRPAVVIRKTSFGSQSEHGAKDMAVLMSFFQTARLQDANFLEFMHSMTENHLKN